MKRSRDSLFVDEWKRQFLSSVVLFDSTFCFCDSRAHDFNPLLFEFLFSQDFICPLRFVCVFSRLFSFPSSISISYSCSFGFYRRELSVSTNARLFKEIKDEIDFSSGFVENRVVNGERIAKAVRASERLYKEELYNFGYHEVSSDEEDDEGLQSTDFVENKLCFKELCVLTRSKPLFSLPDFTFQFNPLIQFYKDVYFLFLSFVDFRYSLSSVPSFSLDFSYAILSFSFFRCQEYPHFDLRFTDFYLIFRDLVSDCIENPRLVYFYYSVICESMETYKDLVDQNQGFHYFVKMREEKKSMFQIIKELVIEKRGEAFYHEAVLGKPLERQKDATLDFDQRQIC